MSKKFDIVAITGEYVDRDGINKKRYLNIGAVIETKNGLSMKLEAVPVGWDGWAYLNEPKPREDAPARSGKPAGRQQSRDDFDDTPF